MQKSRLKQICIKEPTQTELTVSLKIQPLIGENNLTKWSTYIFMAEQYNFLNGTYYQFYPFWKKFSALMHLHGNKIDFRVEMKCNIVKFNKSYRCSIWKIGWFKIYTLIS